MRRAGAIASVLAALLSVGVAQARALVHVRVVQTSADLSTRLTRLPDLVIRPGSAYRQRATRGLPVVYVDDTRRFQSISGFGAAMTDTAAWLLEQAASPAAGQATMQALFGSGGLGLDLLRVPMGASDFTHDGRPYTYDDLPAGRTDPTLADFSIAHDEAYILPALRQARALNHDLALLATPWTPPAWMKVNGALDNRDNRGWLVASAVGAWARYFVKFLSAYAAAGVPVDALTLQNEPGNPTAYPGLNLPAGQAARLLTGTLAPDLRAAGLDPMIYGGDTGWSPRSSGYIRNLLGAGAGRALTGLAYHCYFGSPELMSQVHVLAPGLQTIVSECATGLVPFSATEAVISSVRNWASAVSLWNLALDPSGGPVQEPNTGCPGCTALVTVDESTGTVTPTLSYYQLGQASKFVLPGAYRIGSPHFVAYGYDRRRPTRNIATPGLDDAAFVNPDGSHVLLAYANSATPIKFAVQWQGGWFAYTLPARATVTLVWG